MNLFIYLLSSIFVLIIIVFNSMDDLCSNDEIYRKTSPNNLFDIVVKEVDCGATSSAPYHIFIVPTRKAVIEDGQSPFIVMDHMKNFKIFWKSSRKIIISYREARIFNFNNFAYLYKKLDDPYVWIILDHKTSVTPKKI